jgi:DNA processing protein
MADGTLKGRSARFPLSDEQKLTWLMLIRSENVGPATFRDLINHFGSAAAALDALPELAKRGGVAARIRIATRDQAQAEINAAKRVGAYFVGLGEPGFPPLLRAVDHPPPLLCVRGNIGIADRPCIGVVGSRNASITGIKLTGRFCSGLGRAGYVCISGLARGIDAAAHKASLDTGTIAVFAGGVDKPFPDENIPLAADIVSRNGVIVSEMPIGWSPRATDFPRRNRLIAGMSLGVLVVEAAKRSGSLITARLANEGGRFVFAVPGSPLDPRAAGANYLIRQGATLVTEVSDITEVLAPIGGDEPQLPFDAGEDEDEFSQEAPVTDADEHFRQKIICGLGPAPVEVDDIIRFSGASPGEVQLILLELDLAGRLDRHPGNRVSLRPRI